MKKHLILIYIVGFLLAACNNLNSKLEGHWVVSQAYYHNKPVMWDLYGNGFSLKDDKVCSLPTGAYAKEDKTMNKGEWILLKENKKIFLKITTSNFLFNRTFEIKNLRTEIDEISKGYLLKMILESDSLKLDCVKAIY